MPMIIFFYLISSLCGSLFLENLVHSSLSKYSLLYKIGLQAVSSPLLGLPLFLLPSISILSTHLPTHSSSLLITWPYHLTVSPVLSLIFPWILSLLILLSRDSAHPPQYTYFCQSKCPLLVLLIGHASALDIIAGLTTDPHNFPFIPITQNSCHILPVPPAWLYPMTYFLFQRPIRWHMEAKVFDGVSPLHFKF